MPWPPSLRQAVRLLPEPAQLLLKRGAAALGDDDWAASIARVRALESAFLEETAREQSALADRKRVLLFALQQVPPWLNVEYGLATALQLRGHDVHGVLCDGVLPICEMSLGGAERPACGVCTGWLTRYEQAFGFSFARLTEFISVSDREEAIALVAASSADALLTLVVDGVEAGRLARRELQRASRGFAFDPSADPAFRQWLVSAVLLVRMAGRLLDRERPDIVIAGSGRTLPAACVWSVARRRGTHVVTWDAEATYDDGVVFSHNEAAPLIPLDDAWRAAAITPLTAAERRELHAFLDAWARRHHDNGAAAVDGYDAETVRRHLGLRSGVPIVAAFTNSAWDVAAIDRDAGFGSMFEWLFALVEYAAAHPGVDVVVRAHPAEAHPAADLRSRTPVRAEILRRIGRLPPNVVVIDGSAEVNSYALAAASTVVMAYASRIGLEVAVRGRRPWIAGDTTYRNKGFTRDLTSRQHMVDLLDASAFDDALAPEAVERAEQFAYLWFFRYVTRLPLLRSSARPFRLDTFRELAPGGHPAIDRICDAMVTGAPFVDLA